MDLEGEGGCRSSGGMAPRPRLTPMERIRKAKEMRKRAATQPGLSLRHRAELRRHTKNLVMLNLSEAKRRKSEANDPSNS